MAWHGMAWQSIRGTGAGGGERTVENYVKMFWIVKPDGRTEKSHCTATGQDEVAWRGGEGEGEAAVVHIVAVAIAFHSSLRRLAVAGCSAR